MSCIPKLLEIKGNKDFLKLADGIVLESGDNYKGYDFCVTFNEMGFRCGYVAITAQHPFSQYANTYDAPIEVHGGVTFHKSPKHFTKRFLNHPCEDTWIGFDCNHGWDLMDSKTREKYFPKSDKTYLDEYINFMGGDCKLRTNEYVTNQCKRMIEQLIAAEIITSC